MPFPLRVTISLDAVLLTRGGRPAKRAIPLSRILEAAELEVTILPLLIGGRGSNTLTGQPCPFLPGDIRWKILFTKETPGGIVVRYRRI